MPKLTDFSTEDGFDYRAIRQAAIKLEPDGTVNADGLRQIKDAIRKRPEYDDHKSESYWLANKVSAVLRQAERSIYENSQDIFELDFGPNSDTLLFVPVGNRIAYTGP